MRKKQTLAQKKTDLFARMAGKEQELAIDEFIEQMFEIYDDDGNDFLELEEIRPFVQESLAAMGKDNLYSEQAFVELFSMFDGDGTGKLDQNEVK